MTEPTPEVAPEPIRWIDNHCHLPPGHVGDEVIARAAEAGVVRFVDVGTDHERSRQVIASAARHPDTVFATVGVHPHDATEGTDGLAELAADPGVVAIGECGLDYHYDHSPRPVQREAFAAQIALAHELDLPLVIHTREAWDDTFAVLDAETMPDRTVFHCFTGGPAEAEAALERGAVLSFSGIVTFGNAEDLRAAAALCPIDRLMVETDSPYLAPVPHRGKQNEPANLPFIGERIAQIHGVGTALLAATVWETTHRFFRLPTA
jgi:TatD DNase family protein